MDFAQPLEIDLQDNGGKQVLHSYDEAESWVLNEIGFYDWLRQVPPQENAVAIANNALNPLSQAHSHLKQAEVVAANPPQTKNSLDSFANSAREAFLTRKLPHSSTARAKFVEELRQHNPRVAAYALAYFIQIDRTDPTPGLSPVHSVGYAGIIQAFLFEHGLKGRATSEADALTKLHSKWTASFEDLNGQVLSMKWSVEALLNEASSLLAQLQKVHATQVEEQRSFFGSLVAECRTKLADLENVYNEKLALRAPITFWEERRKRHRNLSWAFGVVFVACVAGALFALHSVTGWLLSPGDATQVAGVAVEKFSYSKLGVVGLYTVGAIWVLRILARLLLSNIHLGTDAGERVVMAKTYLALLQDEKATTEQDRSTILQALFRPSATGVVQDDGLPHIVANMLTKTEK